MWPTNQEHAKSKKPPPPLRANYNFRIFSNFIICSFMTDLSDFFPEVFFLYKCFGVKYLQYCVQAVIMYTSYLMWQSYIFRREYRHTNIDIDNLALVL